MCDRIPLIYNKIRFCVLAYNPFLALVDTNICRIQSKIYILFILIGGANTKRQY